MRGSRKYRTDKSQGDFFTEKNDSYLWTLPASRKNELRLREMRIFPSESRGKVFVHTYIHVDDNIYAKRHYILNWLVVKKYLFARQL